MIPALLAALAISLVLTLALETGFFFVTGKRDKKDLLLVILANIITNPVVVLTYWLTVLHTDLNTVIIIIPLEVFAVVTEGYHYKKFGRSFRRPYLFSLAANIFSYGTGVLIQFIV